MKGPSRTKPRSLFFPTSGDTGETPHMPAKHRIWFWGILFQLSHWQLLVRCPWQSVSLENTNTIQTWGSKIFNLVTVASFQWIVKRCSYTALWGVTWRLFCFPNGWKGHKHNYWFSCEHLQGWADVLFTFAPQSHLTCNRCPIDTCWNKMKKLPGHSLGWEKIVWYKNTAWITLNTFSLLHVLVCVEISPLLFCADCT